MGVPQYPLFLIYSKLPSFLPAPQLDVTKTIWRVKRQKQKQEKKIEQENGMIKFTLSIALMANEDSIEGGAGRCPPPLHFMRIENTLEMYVFS